MDTDGNGIIVHWLMAYPMAKIVLAVPLFDCGHPVLGVTSISVPYLYRFSISVGPCEPL